MPAFNAVTTSAWAAGAMAKDDDRLDGSAVEVDVVGTRVVEGEDAAPVEVVAMRPATSTVSSPGCCSGSTVELMATTLAKKPAGMRNRLFRQNRRGAWFAGPPVEGGGGGGVSGVGGGGEEGGRGCIREGSG